MNNHDQERHDEVVSESTASPGNSAPNSKRRLLKVGVSAVPVVLTLTSRPVLAWHCQTPSVNASANLSHPTQQQADEGTKTISYWSSVTQWPKYDRDNCKLKDMFGGIETTKCKDALVSGTMLQKYLIAAMLNIQPSISEAGLCLSEAQVQVMYQQGPSGNYQPMSDSPSVKWGSTEIINYLRNNWIVTG